MKILLICQYFLGQNDSGGSRFNQFVKYWEELGHEITVVAGTVHYTTGEKESKYKGKWIVKEKYSDNVTIYRTYVSESYNKSFRGRLWGYFSFTFSSLYAALFKIKKHDVMMVSSPPLFVGITGILLKLFKRTPMIFEIRDLWPESAIDIGVVTNKALIHAAYLVEKLSYKFSDKINVLTPAFKKALIEKKNVPENKIIFIPNGADLDIFQPGEKENWVRDQYNLKGKFVITYMGAHGVANYLDSILNTAKICREYPDIVFLLIGDGMEKKRLMIRAEEEQIENVVFIPPQPKKVIPDFCNASDVCTAVLKNIEIYKTVYPNKVFDYMSCKKPILLGINGVARELIEKSNCGYFVDVDNPEDFKNKILSIYQDSKLIETLGENGYEYVRETFNRENLSKTYIEEIEKIVRST
ncbi:glycosyltransferase family 4 protein [Cytobacillus dafuensis]|uniref:Glycosyltransferase family 4 protein n=1 Tax=Cytobacillus dafuensis TaxID=1742359 RepID=A0A5B8Z8A8_CYTDA|nr:glycosyltransferase family 4 protein [Cytobacillus dafuensis]QED49188.1 glycosyltransferase family 4 protein [Cytobacillus dafuensis]